MEPTTTTSPYATPEILEQLREPVVPRKETTLAEAIASILEQLKD